MESLETAQFGPNVLFVGGEIDMMSAPKLERALSSHVHAGGPIVVDLSAVHFMDSSGLHVLANAAARMPTGCLIIHGAQRNVAKILELVRLSDIDNIHVQPCMVDPYPNGSARSSEELSARLESLRATFHQLRDMTESSHERTSEIFSAAQRGGLGLG